MASKEAQAEFQQYQAVQLAVISRLKQAYYRLQYTYAATDLLVRNRDLLEKLLKGDRRPLFGRARRATGCLQGPDPTQHPRNAAGEARTGAAEPERRDRQHPEPRGGHTGRPARRCKTERVDGDAGRTICCRAPEFADAGPRSEDDRAVGAGGQHGAQGILSRRHAQRGLLQHGVDAAHV